MFGVLEREILSVTSTSKTDLFAEVVEEESEKPKVYYSVAGLDAAIADVSESESEYCHGCGSLMAKGIASMTPRSLYKMSSLKYFPSRNLLVLLQQAKRVQRASACF